MAAALEHPGEDLGDRVRVGWTARAAGPAGAELRRGLDRDAAHGAAPDLADDRVVLGELEAVEEGTHPGVEVRIVPGLSAMQAAAARVGAPLGHDFCVLSLSDQLKPWEVIEQRLEAAGAADLVLALYNPASRTRREQLASAIEILRRHRAAATPVVVARAVGDPDAERVTVTTLAEIDLDTVDMRTLLIVGSSTTRLVGGGSDLRPP